MLSETFLLDKFSIRAIIVILKPKMTTETRNFYLKLHTRYSDISQIHQPIRLVILPEIKISTNKNWKLSSIAHKQMLIIWLKVRLNQRGPM